MEAFITVAGIAALFVLNVLISYALAWLLTEKITPIKVKPFSCRACMSFWLTLVFGLFLAWILIRDQTELQGQAATYGRWFLAGWAFLTALINYLYINAKFKIYE